MKGSHVLKQLLFFCKAFSLALLAVLLLLGLTAFAFDRFVAAEIPRAFPEHLPIADSQLRRSIADTFEFRPFNAEGVHEVFAKEHPGLEHFLGRGLARALVSWCVYLHESSRLEATMRGTSFFDKNEEVLVGLDAASRHWHHHGIESATPQELQELKEHLFGPKHPAWRRYYAKHPAGDGT